MTTSLRRLLFLFLPAVPGVRADLLHFDDLAPGAVLTTQYPAISPLGGPVVSTYAHVSKFNCLAQVEPATATSADGGGAVMLDFTAPRSRVKVRAGYALDPLATKAGPASITLTAWGFDTKSSTWYVAGTETKTVTGPEVFVALEVCRALDHDIRGIDIEASGARIEILDNLEHFDYSASTAWTANFDTVPAGTGVTGHYAGVQFTENAVAVDAALMAATAGSGSQIVVPASQPESHTQAFSFELEPPQGAVRLLTGYPGSAWNSTPLTVRVQAFNSSGTELARVERIYNAVRPLDDPVAFCRWDQQDIARVSVHFLNAGGTPRSLGGVECFDSLTFGPVNPSSLSDTAPPQVFISAPAAYEATEVMAHRDDNTRSFAIDVYSFENVSQSEMWITQENVTTGALTTIPLSFGQLGEIPAYTPPGGSPVTVPAGHEVQTASTVVNYGPGAWRWRAYARDAAGNVSSVSVVNERLRSLNALPASTYPALTGEPVFMGTVNEPVMGMPWTPPASVLATTMNLNGTNLHRDSLVMFVRDHSTASPSTRERYLAPQQPGTLNAERTLVRVNVPGACFNLAANDGANLWEIWVQDTWARPGAVEWTKLGNARVGPWYPEVYGFGFRNVGNNAFGLAEFDCIYGRTLMLNGARDGVRNPSRMLFAAVGLPILSEGEGHCFGYSMTAAHLRRRWLDPRFYGDPTALVPRDLTVLGPDRYRGGDLLELALPDSLFAQIKAFHGGQLSEEVIRHVLDQMSGHFSWQGNPVAVLNRIRANPHDYIVTMLSIDNLSESHVLTPYAVRDVDATWSEILVYDSNFHGTLTETQDGGVNPATGRLRWLVSPDHCRNTRILVNRTTNQYSYSTSDPWRRPNASYLSGTGLYTIPVNMFLNDRTPPGFLSNLGRILMMFIAGNADARYRNAAGQMAGINPDGSPVYTLENAYALPLTTDDNVDEVGPQPSPFLLAVPGSAMGQITAEMRHSASGAHFYAADSGVIFQLSSTGAQAGETDQIVIDRASSPIDTAALIPGGSGRTWYPRIGVENPDGSAVVWRVLGLSVNSGERMEFAPRTGSTGSGDEWLDLRNRTEHPVTFRLVLERGNAASTAPDAASYGPLTIPAGGNARLYPLPGGQMNFAPDADADGIPETVSALTGAPLFTGITPVADCDGNGLPDALDIAEGRLADSNGNLIPDDCETASISLTSLTQSAGGASLVLELRGTPGSQWTLERSAGLSGWTGIETLTFSSTAVTRTVNEPAGTGRMFYRLKRH